MDPYSKELEKRERKRDKKIHKIIKRSAIAFGAGLGFFFMIPILPDIADKEKMSEMRELFSLTGLSVAGYGVFMAIAIFFFRNRILMVDALMNWFIVPSYGLWFAFEAYKILAQ